eukprot:3952201-Alexandrium_andersonii.AAC.1
MGLAQCPPPLGHTPNQCALLRSAPPGGRQALHRGGLPLPHGVCAPFPGSGAQGEGASWGPGQGP